MVSFSLSHCRAVSMLITLAMTAAAGHTISPLMLSAAVRGVSDGQSCTYPPGQERLLSAGASAIHTSQPSLGRVASKER